MKKTCLIIFFFINQMLFSQVKSIDCEYIVNVKEFEFKDTYQKEMFEIVKKNIVDYKFQLKANQNKCFFSEIKKLSNDDNKYDIIKLAVNMSNDVFISISDSLLIKTPNYSSGVNLICNFNSWSWELLDESKLIEGFVCNKSIGSKVIISEGNSKTVHITAWYCPSIPFKFGPSEFHGLPGLIFEVSTGNIVYGLNSIKFNDFEYSIEKPKGKYVKEEEYLTNK